MVSKLIHVIIRAVGNLLGVNIITITISEMY